MKKSKKFHVWMTKWQILHGVNFLKKILNFNKECKNINLFLPTKLLRTKINNQLKTLLNPRNKMICQTVKSLSIWIILKICSLKFLNLKLMNNNNKNYNNNLYNNELYIKKVIVVFNEIFILLRLIIKYKFHIYNENIYTLSNYYSNTLVYNFKMCIAWFDLYIYY